MNDRLKHFRSLPRKALQSELRNIINDKNFYLWEYIGLGWFYNEVRAEKEVAVRLGIPEGTVIGYHVIAGHVQGGALNDLININATSMKPPYPDPFV